MSDETNDEAVSNTSDRADYGEEARYEVKGRRYHEKKKVRKRGHVVCVARTEMKEFPHTEKQPSGHGITGRYQEKNGSFTIHFNQAGTYVEAVFARIAHGDPDSKDKDKRWQARNARTIVFMWGREEKDGSFRLTPNPGQEVYREGEKESVDASHVYRFRVLKAGEKLKLKMWIAPTPESSADTYELIHNEPDDRYFSVTYMKEVLETLPKSMKKPNRAQIKMFEHAPLTKQYYRWLVRALTEEVEYLRIDEMAKNSLAGLIRKYAKTPKGSRMTERLEREKAVREIGWFLNYAVFPTRGPKAWHFQDLILASAFAKLILFKNKLSVPGSTNKTYMTWLQEAVDQYARDGEGTLGAAEKYLDITPRTDKDKPRFKYTAVFDFKGLQGGWWIFGGGYFEGKLKIKQERRKSDGSWDEKWKKTYHAWMYVGGSNSGISVTFDPTAVGYSDSDWSYRDMHGDFNVLSAEGAGDLVEIDGSGSYPTLRLEHQNGIGRAPSLSAATGTIQAWDKKKDKPPKPPKNKGPYVAPWKAPDLARPETQVHFRCGSAKLTDAAIRRIGNMCARELRSFRIRDNWLWIFGHADRVDTVKFNDRLSELRAKNTLTVIKAILGKNLLVSDIYAKGYGESEAESEEQPNGDPNQKYRRVDIILGGRLVGSLYGE